MFTQGHLTRRRAVDPRDLTFALIDIETTGLEPRHGARACEIGVVRMRGDGTVLDEYSTLVDPGRPITNSEYHGITDLHVREAPAFADVAGDVLAYLAGAVVVGHNLEFQDRFLTAEFARLGVRINGIPGLCSMVTTRIQLDRHGYRLKNVAHLVTGEWPGGLHRALDGARTLGWMLTTMIAEAPQPLFWAGPSTMDFPAYPRTGRIAPRAVETRKGTEGWLASLISRLPNMVYPPTPQPSYEADYRAMLGHALSDGRIVGDEATRLGLLASRAGLTQSTARVIHEEFLKEARKRAEADGVVTTTELRELRRAAKELSATHLIGDLEATAATARARRSGALKGMRVLAVGESGAVGGVVDFAVENGAAAAVNPTGTVRLVVAEALDDADPRIVKARELGIEITGPEQAMEILRAEIESAGLLADARGAEVARRLSRETAPVRMRGGPPEWHEFWRPRELAPAEYKARFVTRNNDWDTRSAVHRKTAARAGSAGQSGCATTCLAVGGVVAGIAALLHHVLS